MSLSALPFGQLLSGLKSGEFSSQQLVADCLSQIDQSNPAINAFLEVWTDDALAEAAQADERSAHNARLGPLDGVPVAVKDVLCVAGRIASCGSKMLNGFRPPYDATVIKRLKDAGAVLLGRTNMDEFAMGSSSENSAYGVTRNPWDTDRIPGGSSGGSAAAVAARMAPLALGTDTGGSIRQPAGLCGILGLKPTYGRVSRYGLVAYASSLDQVGPFATDAAGTAHLLAAIAGYDPHDSTSINTPVPDYVGALDQPLAGMKIGFCPEHFGEGLDGEVAQVVRTSLNIYRKLGAELREVELPHMKYSIATYYLIAPAEASSNLSRYDGIHYGHRANEFGDLADLYARSRSEGFGHEVRRRIMLGVYALSAGYYDQYYAKALKVRRLIRQDFDEAFQEVDLIAGPVTATPAFKLGEKTSDPLAMYLSDVYTISANLAGIPAMSIPAGFSSGGLPIGLQLWAPPFEEARLLQAAQQFERETDWHTRGPTSMT